MNLILARALACTTERCHVQPLDGGDPLDAPLAPIMIEIGTRIRPDMIVALDRDTTPPIVRDTPDRGAGGRPPDDPRA